MKKKGLENFYKPRYQGYCCWAVSPNNIRSSRYKILPTYCSIGGEQDSNSRHRKMDKDKLRKPHLDRHKKLLAPKEY